MRVPVGIYLLIDTQIAMRYHSINQSHADTPRVARDEYEQPQNTPTRKQTAPTATRVTGRMARFSGLCNIWTVAVVGAELTPAPTQHDCDG